MLTLQGYMNPVVPDGIIFYSIYFLLSNYRRFFGKSYLAESNPKKILIFVDKVRFAIILSIYSANNSLVIGIF